MVVGKGGTNCCAYLPIDAAYSAIGVHRKFLIRVQTKQIRVTESVCYFQNVCLLTLVFCLTGGDRPGSPRIRSNGESSLCIRWSSDWRFNQFVLVVWFRFDPTSDSAFEKVNRFCGDNLRIDFERYPSGRFRAICANVEHGGFHAAEIWAFWRLPIRLRRWSVRVKILRSLCAVIISTGGSIRSIVFIQVQVWR